MLRPPGSSDQACDYLVRVLDGDYDPVITLASQLDNHSGPAAVADGEGNPFLVPSGPRHDHAREPGARQPQPVDFVHTIWHDSRGHGKYHVKRQVRGPLVRIQTRTMHQR